MKTNRWLYGFFPGFLVFFPAVLLFCTDPVMAAGQVQTQAESEGLIPAGRTDFVYAQCVEIQEYENGFKRIDVQDDASYLLVPKGEEIPENIPEDIRILQVPSERIYLAATASMALFDAIGGLDHIKMSSLKAPDWYVDNARKAMEAGQILYAGKYSEPDFELLLAQNCDLAIESTMIYHSPKTKEMTEQLGIPVFVDRSSYEPHPLGRCEWIKVYGAMIGKEKEAESFFDSQLALLDELDDYSSGGKTVAFFSVNSSNVVVVRRNSDYVPRMIEMAGGTYALSGIELLKDESGTSTVNMTMEEFYAAAVNADYLVYNASIEAPLYSINDLIGKNKLFAGFKAVKEGQVWCTDRYLYQATDIVGQLIRDFHIMLTGGDESEITFLKHLS